MNAIYDTLNDKQREAFLFWREPDRAKRGR